MKKPNKEERLNKWDSVLSGMRMSEEKKEWMSQYAELHTTNEIVSTPDTIITLQPTDNNILFPMAKRIFAQTIGQDLVSVQPMGGGNSGDEMKKIKQEVKIENRDRKIDALVEGKEFNEMKTEDHPDYIKPKGPIGQLFYMDMVYGSTNSTTI
jgi:hypothetical protein